VPAEPLWTTVLETFETLSDPTRARMLYAIARWPLSVRDLALLAGVSRSAATHQLRFLRDRHLVKSRREGNVIYRTADE